MVDVDSRVADIADAEGKNLIQRAINPEREGLGWLGGSGGFPGDGKKKGQEGGILPEQRWAVSATCQPDFCSSAPRRQK